MAYYGQSIYGVDAFGGAKNLTGGISATSTVSGVVRRRPRISGATIVASSTVNGTVTQILPHPITVEDVLNEIDLDWIGLEPPGLWPIDQGFNWRIVNHIFTTKLQEISDQLTQWWFNMDPRTCDVEDLSRWESMMGIPVNTTIATSQRRAVIMNRLTKGPFTRTRRAKTIGLFIQTSSPYSPVRFVPGGTAFPAGGIPFGSVAITDPSFAFRVIEDIPNYHYTVYILNTVSIDLTSLARELDHITPAPITFTITPVSTLP